MRQNTFPPGWDEKRVLSGELFITGEKNKYHGQIKVFGGCEERDE